jgi:hypothetical protein
MGGANSTRTIPSEVDLRTELVLQLKDGRIAGGLGDRLQTV